MTTFPNQFDYNIGSLDSTPVQRSTHLKKGTYENDVYEFNISVTRNINLSLHNITSGFDADLYLYRDSNGNGVIDATDTLIQGSYRGRNADDAINVRAKTGTYFARVKFYSGGSGANLNYDLDISATSINPSSTDAPNLLPREVDVGRLFSGGGGPQSFTDWVGDTDTVDTYAFSLPGVASGSIHLVNIQLENLISDADIRLIEDSNSNGIVDAGEVFDFSVNGGTAPESMTVGLTGGDYFLQVYQYSGDTNYQLTFA
jgi:hypothetical protein